ncbi:hypothetical protein B0T16DRAFT_390534 [Cercophora newfieldiana]|uniref:PXA domain-containing protein n=1 Tax=Cercophora newfieldiana TaxID=92897 RepID=A0AA40CQR2_9PEZI|nr:hypothetical protein B0T16DRAFT_390534 [Cercophora newfieldiana]
MFPSNAPGTPTLIAPSSDAELLALRRRCAKALWALLPNNAGVGGAAGSLFFTGHFSPSHAPPFGRADLSRRGETGHECGRTRGAQRSSASASTSAAVPQAVTEGSAQTHQHGHGPAAALESLSLSSASEAQAAGPQKGLRTAPRGGPQDGSGQPALRARSVDDGAAAALATQSSPRHTDTSDRGGSQVQEDEDDEAILQEIEHGILDVFSDAYSNKHLVYGIVELILVRILPELAEKGATELWSERLSA